MARTPAPSRTRRGLGLGLGLATTPTGLFSTQREIDGQREGHFGTLVVVH